MDRQDICGTVGWQVCCQTAYDKWRICFRWVEGADVVEVVYYRYRNDWAQLPAADFLKDSIFGLVRRDSGH